MSRCSTVFFTVFVLSLSQVAHGALRYVDPNATGNNDGTSWANAYTSLDSALADGSATEIWVVSGTYIPTVRTDGADARSVTFSIPAGVRVYGGFAGTETTRDERDENPATNGTVLSGDLSSNDSYTPGTPPTFSNYTENGYHVVTLSSSDELSRLDGFTITHGYAVKSGVSGPDARRFGACIYDKPSVSTDGDALIQNCIISNSFATNGGGGVYLANLGDQGLRFLNCTVTGNSSTSGAGVYNSSAILSLSACAITSNCTNGSGPQNLGGGFFLTSSNTTTIRDGTQITGNTAAVGGGVCRGAGELTIRGCTLESNTASAGIGGGVAFTGGGGTVVMLMVDCNLIENHAIGGTTGGGAVHIAPRSGDHDNRVNIVNCRFFANDATNGASGGAMWASVIKQFQVTNCLFSNNFSENAPGGAIFVTSITDDGAGTIGITNCTIADNTATDSGTGGGIYYEQDSGQNPALDLANCILWKNSDTDGSTGTTS